MHVPVVSIIFYLQMLFVRLAPNYLHIENINFFQTIEKPIFSIDIHPDGKRFATGGQGNDSGRVVIWSLEAVIDDAYERNRKLPRILCQLDNHIACVNAVRWSNNGSMLASGGDDKLIMLWTRTKGPSSVFGSGGVTKTTENWRTAGTLRGHAGKLCAIDL